MAAIHRRRAPPLVEAEICQKLVLVDVVGAVWTHGGHPRVVFGFTIADGKVVAVEILADPERLGHLELVVLND
jgi:hypothetical protein